MNPDLKPEDLMTRERMRELVDMLVLSIVHEVKDHAKFVLSASREQAYGTQIVANDLVKLVVDKTADRLVAVGEDS